MKIRNGLVLAAFFIGTSMSGHADTLPSHLVAVRIHLMSETFDPQITYASSTVRGQVVLRVAAQKVPVNFASTSVDGYISWSPYDQAIQFSSTTISDQIAGFRGQSLLFWPLADVLQVQFPTQSLVSTTSLAGIPVPLSAIKRLEKITAPFDGMLSHIQFAPPAQLKLRQSGPPIFQCSVYAGEMADEILVSYNPRLNKESMKSLCTKNSDPSAIPKALSDDEINGFLKQGDVFILTSSVD